MGYLPQHTSRKEAAQLLVFLTEDQNTCRMSDTGSVAPRGIILSFWYMQNPEQH
jgi:hypothetical protein